METGMKALTGNAVNGIVANLLTRS